MKRFLLLILTVMASVGIHAQGLFPEGGNMSVLDESAVWVISSKMVVNPIYGDVVSYEELSLKGDTVIDGISFKQEYSREYNTDEDWQPTRWWIGEKDKRVYQYDAITKEYYPIMDLSLNNGESIDIYVGDEKSTCSITAVSDTVFENSTDRISRRCVGIYDRFEEDYWVEGIGSLRYGIIGLPSRWPGSVSMLVKCTRNGETIYNHWSQGTSIDDVNIMNSVVAPVGKTYDLQGRPVSQPSKGVYIENGRKRVVR